MSKTASVIKTDIDDIGHQQNQKIFDVYNIYRLLLSLILLISSYFGNIISALGSINQELFFQVMVVYTIFNIIVLFRGFLPENRTLEISQFISIILIDILFLILISYTFGGVSSGIAILLMVPVASGSLIFHSRLSTFFAAVGSILVIYTELYINFTIDAGIVYFVQAGLLGFMLFTVSGVLQYLGSRIRQNELLTLEQAENILSLQEMNNQIIQRMHNGILVVNREGKILNINDAAKRFLQVQDNQDEAKGLPDIMTAQLEGWLDDNSTQAPPFRLESSSRDLQASFTFLSTSTDPDSDILIFLEDFSLLSSRAQQLKLMSLGRLTASIAHEVRNPLGAISHASQLLSESKEIVQSDQRLLEIIGTHTKRVNLIIENILDLSRNKAHDTSQIKIADWLEQFISKFSNAQDKTVSIDCKVDPPDIAIRFNPGQLEQVLTNICENGIRYSNKSTGKLSVSIEARLSDNNQNPVLHILDDGKGIPEELFTQIFEPFFTTEQSGTGLGLFICKEICDANNARLSYHSDYKGKSCFQINFANPENN
ncbi:MAG: ATP-binding protein [Gammaproteobacteria bacterium]|nr:ATP-binding protein [Gammaproteobacteria bacterium]